MESTPRLCRAALLGLVGVVLLGSGCAEGRATKRVAEVPEAKVEPCTDPRPEMCTMDYRPVCGHHCDEPPCGPDERKTYSNGCGACSHAEVVGWIDGPCPEE